MNTLKENILRGIILAILFGVIFLMTSDGKYILFPKENTTNPTSKSNKKEDNNFKYQTEQFADIKMIRYKVPGFENLDLRQKKLIYYLSQASLSGRDIIFDQNYRHNLIIRRVLEAIVEHYNGDRSTEEWNEFMVYTKRFWFSGGIHHHYSSAKIKPGFSPEYFDKLINECFVEITNIVGDVDGDWNISDIIFNEDIDSKRVNRDEDIDIILGSSNNYYGPNITEEDVSLFYQKEFEERACCV